jgi:hypothetical protein
MAKYSDIKGFTVQTLSTDTIASQAAGGSWASGTSVNTARSYLGSAGIKTALLVFGGSEPSFSNKTESWNGSSWTELNELNTARSAMASGGTYTAAFSAGGRISTPDSTAVSEEWNGTSWAEGNDLNLERYSLALGAGSQTAGLALGGNKRFSPSPSPSYTNDAEEYNGTSWTEVTNMPTGLEGQGANGTQTATAVFGGYNGSLVSTGILYDGTNWTSTTSLPTAASTFSSSGSQTEGLLFGLATPSVASNTLSFDGTAFTELNDLSTARTGGGGPTNAAGTDASAILAAGFTTTYVAVTEEWTAPSVFTKITEGQLYFNSTTNTFKETISDIPNGTWSAGGAVNTARSRFGGATNATQTAGLIFGAGSSPYGQTEEYNGTAWSEQNDLNTGRYISYGGGGTQTACITAGGYNPAGSPAYATVVAEQYNGTSWTEVNDLNEGRMDCATFGTSTGAILVGGGEGPGGPGTVSSVESWDGTSWTETTNIPATRQEMGAWGSTSTAGAIVGGTQDTSPTITAETLEWDGTSWTAGGDYPSVLKYTSVFGSLNSAIVAGGENATAIIGICAHYNGTSWTEVAEMTTARMGCSGNGSAVSGFAASGGTSPGAQTNTEEWTVNLANKTITAS